MPRIVLIDRDTASVSTELSQTVKLNKVNCRFGISAMKEVNGLI